jgi:hypothetical protein
MIRQIEVLQPRAVIFGSFMLLPGVNDLKAEFLEELAKRPAWQKQIDRLSRPGKGHDGEPCSPVLRVLEKADKKAKRYDGTDSLAGLSDEAAAKLIDGCDAADQLQRWHKTAKSKPIRELIAVKLDLLAEAGQ